MDLLVNVLRSPMSFFECTPSGNLLNRFAKEIDAIDCMVPEGLKMMLSYVFKLMEVCIIVLMATPFAAAIIVPLALLYAFVQVHPSLHLDLAHNDLQIFFSKGVLLSATLSGLGSSVARQAARATLLAVPFPCVLSCHHLIT